MLYLNPPYHIINGVALLPDHEDEGQWYYLPVAPHLTTVLDPDLGVNIPQIQILNFRGGAGNGGVLNFDVNLGLEQEALEEIRSEIRRLQRLSAEPRLSPAPLVDGTVKMMLFDLQSGEAPGEQTSGVKFVEKISHEAHPALYGENQASFSVMLTQDGVTLLDRAIQGELSPIGIVYCLSAYFLRPAYSIRLNVDWDRVQKHMDEMFGVDSIFFSSQIETAVDELIETRAIDLEVDTFVPEGEDGSAVLGRRDQAVNEVRDMITDAFFEPSVNPIKEEEDGWDKVEHLARTASALAVTGGWAGLGAFTYRKVDYTRIDRKRLNVNINERTTVLRNIYPQAHLSGLFRFLREPGVDLSRFILNADLDNQWFARRRVRVVPRANFAEDSISSLNVNLEYAGEPKNLVFDAASSPQEVEWASHLVDGQMDRQVTTRYTVNFQDVDGSERPVSLASLDEVTEVETLEIFPRQLYSVVPIPIVALNFPWERYSHVEVQTRYQDPDQGIHQEDVFLLNAETTSAEWKLFRRDPQKRGFQYKVIYRAVDHRDVENAWVVSEDENIILRDPFPPDRRRTLDIVPVFNWEEVERAFVDVLYEDLESGIRAEGSFEFDAENKATRQFVVNLGNPDQRLVSYQVTVVFRDGRLVEIPRSYTLDRRILVRSDMRGHRIVEIRPQDVDFASRQVEELKVDTLYEDQAAALSFADAFTFRSPTDRAHFEYDFVDENKAQFSYRLSSKFNNGLSKTTDWTASEDEEELVLPVG
jgi:hypothetical protein